MQSGYVARINKRVRTRADDMEERQKGVGEGTLVHASQGKRPARELAPGDQVWSHDGESHQWRFTNVHCLTIESAKADMAHLQVCGTNLGLGCSQLVWAKRQVAEPDGERTHASGSWVEARNLVSGDRVLSFEGFLVVEQNALVKGEVVRLVELETDSLHNYAIGPFGILVHNRVPALAAGQTHILTVQGTGAQTQLTLPPIDQNHVFLGVLDPTVPSFDGLHHFTGAFAIQSGVAIHITGHQVTELTPAGGPDLRMVDLRITPLHSASSDAPFDTKVELIEPSTNAVLASKARSTFFPLNWTQAQVIQAIYESIVHYVERTGLPPIGPGIRDATDAGVRMRLHVSGNAGVPNCIISGYPLGAQLQVTAAQAPQ